MTIVTGILISAFTLGVLAIASENVRIALLVWSSCELKWIS